MLCHNRGALNVAVVNATVCYPKDADFNSRVMKGFYAHVKEVEGIGLIHQPCNVKKASFVKKSRNKRP
jgi:hypothetical protein